MLPHRGASLLLAGAALNPPEGEAAAVFAADHPMLPGHFPAIAVVPGVLLLEAAAQLGGLIITQMITAHQVGAAAGRIGVLSAVRKALFHHPLFPGQTLTLAAKVRAIQDFMMVSAVGRLGEAKIFDCDLVLAAAPADALHRLAPPQRHDP